MQLVKTWETIWHWYCTWFPSSERINRTCCDPHHQNILFTLSVWYEYNLITDVFVPVQIFSYRWQSQTSTIALSLCVWVWQSMPWQVRHSFWLILIIIPLNVRIKDRVAPEIKHGSGACSAALLSVSLALTLHEHYTAFGHIQDVMFKWIME